MTLMAYVAGGIILAYLIINHARWIVAAGALATLILLGMVSGTPHPEHPYWIPDRDSPTLEYVYRGEDNHVEFLGWVFEDTGASEWVATFYAGQSLSGVRTVYYPTRREAMRAIENRYGKGR